MTPGQSPDLASSLTEVEQHNCATQEAMVTTVRRSEQRFAQRE